MTGGQANREPQCEIGRGEGIREDGGGKGYDKLFYARWPKKDTRR